MVMSDRSLLHSSEVAIKDSYPVLKMTCAACASSVASMLNAIDGVVSSSVNFANKSASVEYIPTKTSPTEFQKAIASIGYELIIDKENETELKESAEADYYSSLKHKTIGAITLSIPLVVIGMFFMNTKHANWIMLFLSIPVVFFFGRHFFINAFKQARHRKANMDTLVAVSTGVAFVFSLFNTFFPEYWLSKGLQPHVYFEASAVIIAFVLLGKLMEEKAKSNTSTAIKRLIGLQPQFVTIVDAHGRQEEVPIGDVNVGDTIVVKPGEKVAVDGVIVSGSSYVDESMITGEPIAAEKKSGDKVYSGTINQKGVFRFGAEKVGSDTLLAQIIKMVQDAQSSKAPVQKLVDKIASIFVPTVILISILTFSSWMILGGENALTHALLTSVTVLVIACPCALGLATPTAIMVGVGKGADQNVLIKDAESLEQAYKVDTVVLDKTGTITKGKPGVTDVFNISENDVAEVMLAMEMHSKHPIADAIVNYYNNKSVTPAEVEEIEDITGKGVKAVYNNNVFLVGNRLLMDDNNVVVSSDAEATIAELQKQAKTIVLFAKNKKLLSIIAVADEIKQTSKEAIKQLHDLGIEVHMLTGDNASTANVISKTVGINNTKAEVLPADKADYIKGLQKVGKVVAMVGDGINDSQALAQADVSIAMGKGSDIAIDVAKITLITSDLNAIPKAISLSKRTVVTIRQNLFWAFIYNVIGIPIAAGVLFPINGFLLDPMIAGAAMALSSLSVTANSLRLKYS